MDEQQSRVRLNKFLSENGISSRRACDRLIEEGRVTINGKKVYELGSKIDPKEDRILIDGKPLRKNVYGKVVAMMNKPKGVLTTMEDPLERPTIKEFINGLPVRLFPVGRLDWDSEGLLLLTNDGEYAQRVMHPKSEVSKTYIVKLDGSPSSEELQKLKTGVSIIGGRVRAISVSRFQKGDSRKYSWVKIVITEGKNRQIRQMFEKIGYDVLKLQRIAIGRLRLGALDKGQIVFLNEVAAERVFMNFIEEHKVEKTDEEKQAVSDKKIVRKANRKYDKGVRLDRTERAERVQRVATKVDRNIRRPKSFKRGIKPVSDRTLFQD